MSAFIFSLKILAIWATLMAGQMIGGMLGSALFHPPEMVLLNDGPFGVFDGIAVTAFLDAIVLALLAANTRGRVFLRGASLFALYYGVQTLLSFIEAVYFNDYLKLSPAILWLIPVSNLLKCLPACILAVLLWKPREADDLHLSGHIWKVAAIIPLYIAFYFSAGFLIAWQGADVRAYYEQGMNIDQGELALLQVGRGLIWAGLAWIGARQISGRTRTRAALTGLAFAAFMSLQLLMPSSFMPWGVRSFHLVEVFVSNFLFGFLAVCIWRAGLPRKSDLPVSDVQPA